MTFKCQRLNRPFFWFFCLLLSAACLLNGCRKPLAPVVHSQERTEVLAEAIKIHPEPLTDHKTWLITASSQEAEFGPEFLIDANRKTRWSSAFENNQWLQVDLGDKVYLDHIRLRWEDAYGKVYDVQVSSDGDDWQTVFSQQSGEGGVENIVFEPVSVRFVKLNLKERASPWGFSLYEIEFNPPEEELIVDAVASDSSGSAGGAPQWAIDGDPKTRWSGAFLDDVWWQVKFPEPVEVGGMKILWETAFAEKYNVDVSTDGTTWKTVYNMEEGDGLTDLIFFEPQTIQYLKIQCRQRGTGWGNSIWEIIFYKEDQLPVLQASTTRPVTQPVNAMDGNPSTRWHSGDDGEQELIISLPERIDIGGLFISWGDDYATEYEVDADGGNGTWQTVSKKKRGNGSRDMLFFGSVPAEKVRLRMTKSSAGHGYSIANIEFKSGEEQATPIRYYKAAAKESPRGWYPRWLLREQAFWTVTGVIDDNQETLISESGVIEPHKGDFCVQPFIIEEDRLITWNDVELRQDLEEDSLPMPGVQWRKDDWRLGIQAVAFGPVGDSMTIVRYRFSNEGKERFKGKLALAVRPVQLNPIWQHGGFSAIMNAECVWEPQPASVKINGLTRILLPTKPTDMGAVPLEDGDVVEFFSRNKVPESKSAYEAEGKNSIGLMYDLDVPPGESRDIVVAYLLYDNNKLATGLIEHPVKGFESVWQGMKKRWHNLLNRFEIDIPDERLIQMMKSNIAYILINKDGPFIKPGSRNYAHSWIRDGAMTSVTLLRMGLTEPVKNYIEAYTPLVAENGWAPFIILEDGRPVGFKGKNHEGQEYDSQGQYAFLIRQYFDYTGDKELLARVYPTLLRVLQFGKERRAMRMTDEYKNDPAKQAYYGILPESNSHEGYYPAMHSYWDDFWMLRGFKDGAYLADQLGYSEDAAWMRAEEGDLRKCLLASIQRVIARDHLDTIPGCVEKGDFDATSTAIAVMACDEGDNLPEPWRSNTFNKYFVEFTRGTKPGNERTFTPYEVRSADAFIRMGDREKGLAMLRYFTENSVYPHNWNHMAEVIHARKRAPSYIGDMPHTWVGSGYINAVRSIFVYEDNGTLVAAAGIDPKWVDDSGVNVARLPTQYGKLNYRIEKGKADSVIIQVTGEASPPEGFEIPLPDAWKAMTVELNGEQIDPVNGLIVFDTLPARIRIKSESLR